MLDFLEMAIVHIKKNNLAEQSVLVHLLTECMDQLDLTEEVRLILAFEVPDVLTSAINQQKD